ncbi:MAG: hypothetical protein ACJ70U_03890 [Nitrososphaera sp.]
MIDTASGWQSSSITVPKVQPISDIIKNLEAISCDACQGGLASYDVYVDSGIANVSFLKRFCSDCIQKITV